MHSFYFIIFAAIASGIHGSTLKDLQEALDTKERIYLYINSNRPMYSGPFCVNLKQYQDPVNNIYFLEEEYTKGEKIMHTRYTGTLGNGKGEDGNATMTLNSLYDPKKERTYTLRYWNSTEKCFVLSIPISTGRVSCELYQWDEMIDERCEPAYNRNPDKRRCDYRGCELEFRQFCNDPKYNIIYDVTKCKKKNPTLAQ
uniref:Secreted protein n=1 Tax=Amblyomma americanum TaxID=6943 RepID=A0A0C9S553_AMBAM